MFKYLMNPSDGDQSQCPCCMECNDCNTSFQKVVKLKDAGLVIYRHTTHREDVNKNTGIIEFATKTTEDVYILHNTRDVEITSADYLPEIEQNNITCPRCRRIIEHAQKLLQKIQKLDRNDVKGICEHCRTKEAPCFNCREVVKKFVANKTQRADSTKEKLKQWLSKVKHLLKDTVDTNTGKDRIRAHSDLYIDQLCRDAPKAGREPYVEEMFHPETDRSDFFEAISPSIPENKQKLLRNFTQLKKIERSVVCIDSPGKVGKPSSRPKEGIDITDRDKAFVSDVKSEELKAMFFSPLSEEERQNEKHVELKKKEYVIPPVPFQSREDFIIGSDENVAKFSKSRYKSDEESGIIPKPIIKTAKYPHMGEVSQEPEIISHDFDGKHWHVPEIADPGQRPAKKQSLTNIHDNKTAKGVLRKPGELPKIIRKYHSEEYLLANISGVIEDVIKQNFRYVFPKIISPDKINLKQQKSSSELIRDTQDMLLIKAEEDKKKQEEERKRKYEEEEKKKIAREEKRKQLEDKKRADEEKKLAEALERHEHKKETPDDIDKKDDNYKYKKVLVSPTTSTATTKSKLKDSHPAPEKKEATPKETKKHELMPPKEPKDKELKTPREPKEKELKAPKEPKEKELKPPKESKEEELKPPKEPKKKELKASTAPKEKELKAQNEPREKELRAPNELKEKELKSPKELKEKELKSPKEPKEKELETQNDPNEKELKSPKEPKEKELKEPKEPKEKELEVQNEPKEKELKAPKEPKESKVDKDVVKVKKEKEELLKQGKEDKEERQKNEKEEKEKLKKEKEEMLRIEKAMKQEDKDYKQREKDEHQRDKGKGDDKPKERPTPMIKDLEDGKRAKNEADKRAIEAAKLQLKKARETEINTKLEKEKPKVAEKLEEPSTKDLNIKSIKVRVPSPDDLILQLVKIKQSTSGERDRSKRLSSDSKLSSKAAKKRGSHYHKQSKTGDFLVDSDIELDAEILNLTADDDGLTDIIIGPKIFKYKPPVVNTQGDLNKPLLFQSTFDHTNAVVEVKEVATSPKPETIISTLTSGKPTQHAEQELPKGIIRYALSDRTFIDKGWTMLPTEKVVRKMNVYRMRPAHPEFDWFEHNKTKGLMLYDSGEKLAEFDDNGRSRWFYRNGRMALDYYDAEELNAQQRFVIYSSGEPDERGRSQPYTLLATFDYLGNGIVFDHGGKIRLKYNQTEGVVLDRSIGPVSHWKWHTLNDPPVLQQVMIDTQMAHKDPSILKLGGAYDDKTRPDNEDMLAIEFDNFIKEKSKKLSQSFKPFQIKMKALKINEHFSLKVLDQATVYLIFRDGTTNLKLNIGMVLDHKEIVDTDTAEVGEVSNNMERLPARTDSLAGLQKSIAHAQHYDRARTERELRLRPTIPRGSADRLVSAASRPMNPPFRTGPSGSTTTSAECYCKCSRKPTSSNLYYDTRLC